MTEFKKGDRVHFEGDGRVVAGYDDDCVQVVFDGATYSNSLHRQAGVLTKIEPPVVTFGPGQIVEPKFGPSRKYLIWDHRGSWVAIGEWGRPFPRVVEEDGRKFTSDSYKLVEPSS